MDRECIFVYELLKCPNNHTKIKKRDTLSKAKYQEKGENLEKKITVVTCTHFVLCCYMYNILCCVATCAVLLHVHILCCVATCLHFVLCFRLPGRLGLLLCQHHHDWCADHVYTGLGYRIWLHCWTQRFSHSYLCSGPGYKCTG